MAEIAITIEDDWQQFLEPETAVSSADLSDEERDRYRGLLANIDRLQQIEDEQVAKNLSLAIYMDEDWQLL